MPKMTLLTSPDLPPPPSDPDPSLQHYVDAKNGQLYTPLNATALNALASSHETPGWYNALDIGQMVTAILGGPAKIDHKVIQTVYEWILYGLENQLLYYKIPPEDTELSPDAKERGRNAALQLRSDVVSYLIRNGVYNEEEIARRFSKSVCECSSESDSD